MHLGPEKLLEIRKEYLLPCLGYFYKNPPQFVKGDMQYLYDSGGKKYLDFFAGVSVVNCGHCNPFILERTIAQMKELQHVCNIYLTQPVAELAKKMAEILPGGLKRSFFCNSGSEAVEGAMLLARKVSGKKKFVCINGSLHGRTHITMAATSIPMWRADPFLSEDFIFIDFDIPQLKAALEENNDIAALIAEPIQGNAGIRPAPENFFKEAKQLLKKHNAFLIIDEVQTGFARCGKMFCIENYDTVPDIMAYSKAFGNGVPMAGFSCTEEIAKEFTTPSASTLGGNPVSCAAALAVIEYIEQNNLCKQAEAMGSYLFNKLEGLKHSSIKELRGKGLMLGLELESAEIADDIIEALKDRGIILGKNGLTRNVLAFQPPLVITKEDIDFLVENLEQVFKVL